MVRSLLYVSFFSFLFGLGRALERFLAIFVRQDSGEALLPAISRNLTLADGWSTVLAWTVFGAIFALALAYASSRFGEADLEASLSEVRRAYLSLLVPVTLTAGCVLSLALSPSFPYGLGLVVSLGLEGPFQTLLTALLFAGILAHALARLHGSRSRVLPGWALLLLAMTAFTLATPARFYTEGVGQGNMFKYVRMAQALSGTGTLDISRAEENDEPSLGGLLSNVPGWVAGYARASWSLLSGGEENEARASRVNRSMFRSVGGGVHYINAPGPGVLLTPAYLLDRYLERWLGWDRQVAIIVFWQLLGALLVLQMVRANEEVAVRSAGVLVAFAVALAVPFLFYTFQIYPELPAALLILYAVRRLVLDPAPNHAAVFMSGIALAGLPWLHQKYSVLAAVLGLYGAYRLNRTSPGGIRHHPVKLLLLGAPLALSAYSIFLYNHALTGSLAPTATFEAAERSSFEPWNFFKGLSGLLLDRENGLFIFAPVYVLALVGTRAFFYRERPRYLPLAVVILSYLVVIASFPYWPGAISTMGRYILSVLPLFALPMAIVAERALSDGLLAGVSLTLVSASLSYSASFIRDLVPSHQPWLFWERILFCDPHQYLPSFLTDGFLGSGKAHFPKFLVLAFLVGLVVYLLRDRVYREPASVGDESARFHRRATAGALSLLLLVLAGALALERWPGNETERAGPTFRDAAALSGSRLLWAFGEHGFEGGGVWVEGGGSTRFWLRSPEELNDLTLRLSTGPRENEVVFEERGSASASMTVPPDGPHPMRVRLQNPYRFRGARGERFVYEFTVYSKGGFVPASEGRGDDTRRLGVYVRVR